MLNFYIRFSKLTRDIEPIDMEIQIGDMSCMGYVFLKGNIHVTCMGAFQWRIGKRELS